MNIYRHGDLSLHEVEKIEGELKAKDRYVLAEGETTGHKHVVSGDVEIYQDTFGNTYLKVNGRATVTHEEHRKITLKPGNYKMHNEREYNWFENSVQKVLD